MKSRIILTAAIVVSVFGLQTTAQRFSQQKPNILVIWGDDIGTSNISFNNRGMMG